MRCIKLFPVALIALLCVALLTTKSTAQTVNAKGATNSPVPVGTTTPVVILGSTLRADPSANGPRCADRFDWTGTANLICAPILAGATLPTFTPDATHGYFFTQRAGGYSFTATQDDTSLGWSCVATAPAVVYTFEESYCSHQGSGHP